MMMSLCYQELHLLGKPFPKVLLPWGPMPTVLTLITLASSLLHITFFLFIQHGLSDTSC